MKEGHACFLDRTKQLGKVMANMTLSTLWFVVILIVCDIAYRVIKYARYIQQLHTFLRTDKKKVSKMPALAVNPSSPVSPI